MIADPWTRESAWSHRICGGVGPRRSSLRVCWPYRREADGDYQQQGARGQQTQVPPVHDR